MLGIFKRIVDAGRAMFMPPARAERASAKPATTTKPALEVLATDDRPVRQQIGRHAAWTVTISKPEPIAMAAPMPLPPTAAGGAAPQATARPTSKVAARAPTPLRSLRHARSPIAVQKTVGRSIARTPRPAKAAAPTPVRVNRISADQVRMQAALMRAQRQRAAERALARMKAVLPTATILKLQRAA